MANLIVLAVVIAIVGTSVYNLFFKGRKNGKKGCGCGCGCGH